MVKGPVLSAFLALPAELRNHVYNYDLNDYNNAGKTVLVSEYSRQPPLLSTNRQIGSETFELWHLGQSFIFPVVDCKTHVDQAYARNMIRPHGRDFFRKWSRNVTMRLKSIYAGSWDFLMEWCKAVWARNLLRTTAELANSWTGKNAYAQFAIVNMALRLARDGRMGPWGQVEGQLAQFKRVVEWVDDAWQD